MIEWVHRWNKEHPKDRVQVIGVDANENPDARETLRDFLGRAYGEALLKRWTVAERELVAADEQTAVFGDSGIDAATRQLLLEIVAMMKLDAPILTNRVGAPTFNAALEAAQTLTEFADFNSGADSAINHSRDWYMAARVLRVLQEKGASAKAVYWAHNAHVVHPPARTRLQAHCCVTRLGANTPRSRLLLAKVPLWLKFLTIWKIVWQCPRCHQR